MHASLSVMAVVGLTALSFAAQPKKEPRKRVAFRQGVSIQTVNVVAYRTEERIVTHNYSKKAVASTESETRSEVDSAHWWNSRAVPIGRARRGAQSERFPLVISFVETTDRQLVVICPRPDLADIGTHRAQVIGTTLILEGPASQVTECTIYDNEPKSQAPKQGQP